MSYCPSSKAVLVVDDQPSLLQMVRFALQVTGLRIIEAADGIEALQQLKRHSVDMVISDWKMPNMNGLELLHAIRQTEGLEGLPFVMISCENDPAVKREAMACGASSWVKKPFRIHEIQSVVETVLTASSLSVDVTAPERNYA